MKILLCMAMVYNPVPSVILTITLIPVSISCWNDKYKNDVYNIGSDQEITIYELASTIIKLTGSGSKIIHLPPLKEGDMTKRQPDISKMKEILGRDLLSYKEGIVKILTTRGSIILPHNTCKNPGQTS